MAKSDKVAIQLAPKRGNIRVLLSVTFGLIIEARGQQLDLSCSTTLADLLRSGFNYWDLNGYKVTCPSHCEPIQGTPICDSDAVTPYFAESSRICPAAFAEGWPGGWYTMHVGTCEYELRGDTVQSIQPDALITARKAAAHEQSHNYTDANLSSVTISPGAEPTASPTIRADTVRVGGGHGVSFQCPANYHAVQYCGSGENLDCDGYSSWMLCEKLPSAYVSSTSVWYTTTGGQQFELHCPSGHVVTGGCFSGSACDCLGARLKLRCTKFDLVDTYGHEMLDAAGMFECRRLKDSQAITGICNSGSDFDCLSTTHAVEYFRNIHRYTAAVKLSQPLTRSPTITRSPTESPTESPSESPPQKGGKSASMSNGDILMIVIFPLLAMLGCSVLAYRRGIGCFDRFRRNNILLQDANEALFDANNDGEQDIQVGNGAMLDNGQPDNGFANNVNERNFHACLICGDEFDADADAGVCCSGNPAHALCNGCFTVFVKSLQSEREIFSCRFFGPDGRTRCASEPFRMEVIQKHLSGADFREYVTAQRLLCERQTEIAVEKKYQIEIKQARQQAYDAARDPVKIIRLEAKRIFGEVLITLPNTPQSRVKENLADQCPHCGYVYNGVVGCMDVQCSNDSCRKHFCGWCLEAHIPDNATFRQRHDIVKNCKFSRNRESSYCVGDYDAVCFERHRSRLEDHLDTLHPVIAKGVVAVCAKDLSRCGFKSLVDAWARHRSEHGDFDEKRAPVALAVQSGLKGRHYR